MADKQIIIDGVDVSGCERHCSDNRNNPNMCYSEMTRTYSNCNPKEKQCNFYITSIEKQLKEKEQECEFSNLRIIQLQETLSQYETDLSTKDCIVETCKAQYKELKAENERLKKEIRLYDCIDKWGTEQCRCACRCLGNEFCDVAEEKMKNIKQTLENIKEIAKKTLNMVDYKTYFKRDNKSLKQEGFKALYEILKIIEGLENGQETS